MIHRIINSMLKLNLTDGQVLTRVQRDQIPDEADQYQEVMPLGQQQDSAYVGLVVVERV